MMFRISQIDRSLMFVSCVHDDMLDNLYFPKASYMNPPTRDVHVYIFPEELSICYSVESSHQE
jgi:hypothetical protein